VLSAPPDAHPDWATVLGNQQVVNPATDVRVETRQTAPILVQILDGAIALDR
jgi:hypothetical protein